MSDLEHSVLASLDGHDPRLLPFLPELLQDLDNLGADPATIEGLLMQHERLPEDARILDLGCGKGSVSLHLLQRHPWRAVGVDGMPAFVEIARQRAMAAGVAERCRFLWADMRTWAGDGAFDAVIFGAIGPVLGDMTETLDHVAPWLAPQGAVVVDAVYTQDSDACRNPAYRMLWEVLGEGVARAGFRIAAEGRRDLAERTLEYRTMLEAIRLRTHALGQRHPEHKDLFEAYLAIQTQEFEILAEDVEDVTLLLVRA